MDLHESEYLSAAAHQLLVVVEKRLLLEDVRAAGARPPDLRLATDSALEGGGQLLEKQAVLGEARRVETWRGVS